MRLEGRTGRMRAQLRKAGHGSLSRRIRRRPLKCKLHYICPPDWSHAAVTSPQPPSFGYRFGAARRSMTMSIPLFLAGVVSRRRR